VASGGSQWRAARFKVERHIPSEGIMSEVSTLHLQTNFVPSY